MNLDFAIAEWALWPGPRAGENYEWFLFRVTATSRRTGGIYYWWHFGERRRSRTNDQIIPNRFLKRSRILIKSFLLREQCAAAYPARKVLIVVK